MKKLESMPTRAELMQKIGRLIRKVTPLLQASIATGVTRSQPLIESQTKATQHYVQSAYCAEAAQASR